MTADFILRSGRFTTLDRSNPTATAGAVTDGRFSAVGRDEDVMPLAGASTRIIDLKGRRALPGLIDNHLHIICGGLNFNMELRWDGVCSLADAMAMLKQQVAIAAPAVGTGNDTAMQKAHRKVAMNCSCANVCSVHRHHHARA